MRDAHGEIAVGRRESVLFCACAGRLSIAQAQPMLSLLDEVIDGSAAPLFVGYSLELEGLKPEARELLVRWGNARARRMRAIVLVRSNIVRMVFTVLNLVARSRVDMPASEPEYREMLSMHLPQGIRNPELQRHLGRRTETRPARPN